MPRETNPIRVPIQMSFVQANGYKTLPTAAYEIEHKRVAWLGRLCVWALRRLGSLHPHFDREMMVRHVVIDPANAAARIVAMASDQLSVLGQHPERILMGRKQFEDLVSDTTNLWRSFSFSIELTQTKTKSDGWGNYKTYAEMFSVPVHVIPWMDGVLVL